MLIITANTAPIGELRFNSTNYNEDLTRQKPQEGKSFETIAAIGNFTVDRILVQPRVSHSSLK